MSIDSEREGHAQHPFFHTMVVMGSALALGCGGMSSSAEPERTSSGGGGGSGGAGGTGPSGGTAGAGGSSGTILIAAGAGSGPVEPGPFECSPAQWVCSADYMVCAGEGYRLPVDCRCDETRPKSPADCAPGESFVCRRATSNSDGVRLTEPVPFDCGCLADQSTCEAACDLLYPDPGTCQDQREERGETSVLCGCAVIVLR